MSPCLAHTWGLDHPVIPECGTADANLSFRGEIKCGGHLIQKIKPKKHTDIRPYAVVVAVLCDIPSITK